MDTEGKDKDAKGCCATAEGKGCCSWLAKCCGSRALAAAALIFVGGLGGFFVGRCSTKGCPVGAPPAQSQAQ